MRSNHSSTRIRTLRRRRLALALVTAMAAPMAMAQDLPTGGVVASGAASINTSGTDMTITQSAQGTIINWGTFDISTGYSVTFAQPNASSVILNRVLGTIGSNIDGALNANGHVFIINTNGITFGSDAQVNVGGLVASTLALSNADFLTGVSTGSYRFGGTTGTPTLRNNGSITAGAGGVAFVGTTLWNRGAITANGGNIAFGAGDSVTLDFVGDGLTQVTINVPPTTDSGIVQDRFGSMTADGGKILLRTAATAGGTGGVIYASGILRAQSIANVNGRIELTSAGGSVMVGAPGIFSDAGSPFTYGSIDVTGGPGETGGSVLITGNGVFLVNDDPTPLAPTYPGSVGSSIDATGQAGGGSITITSTGAITALGLTRIDASGNFTGSGGNIDMLAAGGSVNLLGDILAAGGKVGGDGGRIRIGARDDILQYDGSIGAFASVGNGGQIGLITSTGDISVIDLNVGGFGNGGTITATSAGDINLYGYAYANGLSGDGGNISFVAQGLFSGYGTLDASGGINGGSIYLGGASADTYIAAVEMLGSIDAGGGSGNGGSVVLEGNGGVHVSGDIFASGDVNGGQVHLHGTDSFYYGGVFVEGTVDASGASGDGGLIDFYGIGDVYAIDLLASGGHDGGDISLVGAGVDFSSAIAYGTTGQGGAVSVTADDIYIVSSGNSIDVHGDTGGGSIDLEARNSFVLGENSSLSANTGSSGTGGSIHLYAGNSLVVYGDLSARGVDGGGSIYTGSGGGIDLNGIGIDAGTVAGTAGAWTIAAPQMTVLNGATQGTVGSGPIVVTSTDIQDGDLNNAFATGTSIVLQATGGDVQFDDAQILAAFSSPLFLHVNATGAIYGSGFSIGSSGGALDMLFNADSAGGNDNGGYIDFSNASLSSNGGLIAMFGQSDQAGGFATGYGNGIGLVGVDIDSAGGDVVLSGHSTGGGSGTGYAGVYLDGSYIYSSGGNVDIYGTGVGYASGVIASNGLIGSGGGDVVVEGIGEGYDGIRLDANSIDSAGGGIALLGYGGGAGIYASYSDLSSGGGDILVHGEGGTGNGADIDGLIDSAGGFITLYGHSADATGLDFGGYNSAMISAGGDISLTGIGETGGVALHSYYTTDLDSEGGQLAVAGTAYGLDAVGVYLDGMRLVGGTGEVTIDGSAPLGSGILFANGASVSTMSGGISLIGEGANFGLDLGDGALDTDSGDIYLYGNALSSGATAGVRMLSGGLNTNGGDITVTGNSAGGVGVQLGDGGAFAIGSGGGAIAINGTGVTGGVQLTGATMASGNGDIDIEGTASGVDALGVSLDGMAVNGGAGDVTVKGSAALGSGILFANDAGISTTSGAITLIGIGDSVGLSLDGGEFVTESGHIDLRGRGLGANSDGLLIGSGINIATNGGGIELSGEGGSGAGLSLGSGATVDAGNSLVVLRAANDGSSDAIRLLGSIHSGLGVNLRPGGVDANGGLTERVDDDILLAGGTSGFALSGAELAMIDAPELIIGSNLHAGAIQVLGALSRDGNLTLQNDGGSGGIDIQATLGVGNGTLVLSSGGSIIQTSAGAITAHSLLATAAGDVLLANAQNNVAATTLAGSAGGAFEFQDVDTLAIGTVSAIGFDATSGGLASLGATGIDADGNVLVRNLAGDLILNDDIQGNNIDLVTAGRLQNLGGASLIAVGDWRVWANTWEGETRGGLAGSGDLPNLYGCAFLGSCGVTVPGVDNHFIYIQQPTALITFADFSREYGLANPLFTYTVAGAILGDTASNVAVGAAGTSATIASDVGNYAITGVFTSAAGYRIQLIPGMLAITPAMLFFTADSAVRYLGSPNPNFTGTVTGFRNGDTVEGVFGTGNIWSSPAGLFSPVGFYAVNGGASAKNYVFAQAPGNATALQIIPLPQLSSTPIDLVRETINTYVYDRNFGGAPVCALNTSLADEQLASTGDELSTEWSKVRSRPNLTNCFDTERKDGCGSF